MDWTMRVRTKSEIDAPFSQTRVIITSPSYKLNPEMLLVCSLVVQRYATIFAGVLELACHVRFLENLITIEKLLTNENTAKSLAYAMHGYGNLITSRTGDLPKSMKWGSWVKIN